MGGARASWYDGFMQRNMALFIDFETYCNLDLPKEEPTMKTDVKYPHLLAACGNNLLYNKVAAKLASGLHATTSDAKVQWLWEICCDQAYQDHAWTYYTVPHVLRSNAGSRMAPATTLYFKLLDAITEDLKPETRSVMEPGEKQQARAWSAVWNKLKSINPEFFWKGKNGEEAAIIEIDRLAALASIKYTPPVQPEVKTTERRPFDLEAAKRGEAFETQFGSKGVRLLCETSDGELGVEFLDGSKGFYPPDTFVMSPKPVEKVKMTAYLCETPNGIRYVSKFIKPGSTFWADKSRYHKVLASTEVEFEVGKFVE